MTRRHISTSERVRIFSKAGGRCHICDCDIRVGDKWEVEHVIPMAQGGADEGDNLQPAHVSCHKAKTRADAADTARAKRQEASHIGARAPSRTPLPFGKTSRWKKLMSGRIVPRD
jgi:5-methylcytosine-specific restriction protein A